MPPRIIPNLNFNSYPTSINNAWVSPINPDYCIWFGVRQDTISFPGTPKDKLQFIYSLGAKDTKTPGSYELTPCCLMGDPKCTNSSRLYSLNPVYGYYDITASPRKLHIFVDRTLKNGGIEEYEGVFIDSKTTNYDNIVLNVTAPTTNLTCGGELKPPLDGKRMLLITSKKTGKQTVLYRTITFDPR